MRTINIYLDHVDLAKDKYFSFIDDISYGVLLRTFLTDAQKIELEEMVDKLI